MENKESLEDLTTEFKKLLVSVIYTDKGDPLLFYSAIELAFQKYIDNGFYLTKVDIDITQEVQLYIEATKNPPEDYSFDKLKDLLIDVHVLMSMGGKFLGGLTIEYGRPLNIRIIEDPQNRMTSYDLRKIHDLK